MLNKLILDSNILCTALINYIRLSVKWFTVRVERWCDRQSARSFEACCDCVTCCVCYCQKRKMSHLQRQRLQPARFRKQMARRKVRPFKRRDGAREKCTPLMRRRLLWRDASHYVPGCEAADSGGADYVPNYPESLTSRRKKNNLVLGFRAGIIQHNRLK